MIADLHVHTRLSADSNVAPEQYLEFAQERRGLGAICFTEHRLFPPMPKSSSSTPNSPIDFKSPSSRESRLTPTSAICCCSA